MARHATRDPEIAARIKEAIRAIEGCVPQDAQLRRKAARGTLRLNPTTVAIEARISRHLIAGASAAYGEEYQALAAKMRAKGTTEPLRAQLDRNRRRLKQCQGRLAKSRSYAFQLLVRMHKLEQSNAALTQELENARNPVADEPLIGSGLAAAVPPMPRTRTRGPRQGRAN